MKIAIVMAYYNRKILLFKTLESIAKTKADLDNIDIIICDDGSNIENELEYIDFFRHFPDLNIYIIKTNQDAKTWTNGCVAFNRAIDFALMRESDIIILQNPECYHYTDILKEVEDNFNPDKKEYWTASCYSLSQNHSSFSNYDNVKFNNRGATYDGDCAWYNHSTHRPCNYHFLSIIAGKDMKQLNGFDENFADGISYDDNEFLNRVKKICKVRLKDDMIVLHQWHYNSLPNPSAAALIQRNNLLYLESLKDINKIKAERIYTSGL